MKSQFNRKREVNMTRHERLPEQDMKDECRDSIKREFFRSTVGTFLLYGSSTWTLTRKQEKTLDGTYTRMLRAVLNVSWKSHPTKAPLYGPLPPVSHTIRERRTTFAGHCWRSKDELVSDLLLWQPRHGKANRGRPRKPTSASSWKTHNSSETTSKL